MILPIDRPFELLKLVRDGIITHVGQFPRIADSGRGYFGPESFLASLAELGLIKVSEEGQISPTPLLNRMFGILGLSLTQLSAYAPGSVICSPVFGPWSPPPKTAEVFVVMPFVEALKPVYEDHIKSVANALGLTVARADDFFTASSIISDVWNAICASRIVVADCTGRNANVFYEIGVAHTLGKPVVRMAQKLEDIPFDVQHVPSLIYEFTPRGMAKLEQTLRATIEFEVSRPSSLEETLRRYG
jgi:hypothetical protein